LRSRKLLGDNRMAVKTARGVLGSWVNPLA
jgi:hypothetical protein